MIAISSKGRLLPKRFLTVGEALDWGIANIPHDDWKMVDT